MAAAAADPAVQEFADYLGNVLAFDPEIVEALSWQGYSKFDDVKGIVDEDELDALFSAIRRPGGTILNNNNQEINNPGTFMGTNQQKRFRQLAYYMRYMETVQREFVVAEASLGRLTRLWKFKVDLDRIRKDGNPALPEKFTTGKKSRETIEDIESWIGSSYGIEGTPLEYIVRAEVELPVTDPGFGNPTFRSELIRRAHHTGDPYQIDNEAVFTLMRHVTHGTDAWAFVKQFDRTKDGRGAYLSFKAQYAGASHISQVKNKAENTLNTIFWNGKARNFQWDGFIARHKSAFADLEAYGEGRTDEAKVRNLLSRITDERLAVAKGVVFSNATLLTNYQQTIDYLGGQLDAAESMVKSSAPRNISSTTSSGGDGRGGRGRGVRGRGRGFGRGGGRGGRGRGRGGGGGGRFSESGHLLNNGSYPFAIWNTFTKEEKDYVMDLKRKSGNRNVSSAKSEETPTTVSTSAQSETSSMSVDNSHVAASMTRRKKD
jgi:hypothetical protein